MNKKTVKKNICPIKDCDRVTHENLKYCIFHASAEEKTEDDFRKALKIYVDKIKKEDGDYKFEGFIFIGDINFKKDLNVTIFKNANFKEVTFWGEVDFEDAVFGELANFFNATFRGYAFYKGATFGKYPCFRGAIFEGYANFQNATLGEKSSFRAATFERGACFVETTFGKKLTLMRQNLKDLLNLMRQSFEERLTLGMQSLGGGLSFGMQSLRQMLTLD